MLKKILYTTAIFVFAIISLSMTASKNKELYALTDHFVEQLSTEIESYGLLSKYERLTKDKKYQVKPIGRLINVKIMKPVEKAEYEKLRDDLLDHYEDDERVHDVYICEAGTVMVDCRRK